MCQVFAGQEPGRYESETRSVRLNGYSTSIRLERAFWAMVEEMAEEVGMTTPQFLSKLHDEVTELRGEASNFTSLVRCACLIWCEGSAARRDAKRVAAE